MGNHPNVGYHVTTQKLKLIGGRPKKVYEALSNLGLTRCGMWDFQRYPSRAGTIDFVDGPAMWATQEQWDRTRSNIMTQGTNLWEKACIPLGG